MIQSPAPRSVRGILFVGRVTAAAAVVVVVAREIVYEKHVRYITEGKLTRIVHVVYFANRPDRHLRAFRS